MAGSSPVAVTNQPTYNAGEAVQVRLVGVGRATASIRYAGEELSAIAVVKLSAEDYAPLWTVPQDARTGRYEVDLAVPGGASIRDAGGFTVHRKLAEIESVELDKTFYTSGDAVNPTVKVRNLSPLKLDHLRVEFTGYTIPWIAPMPDEAPRWRTLIADDLSLAAGEEKEFRIEKAAVVQAGPAPVVISFAVVYATAGIQKKSTTYRSCRLHLQFRRILRSRLSIRRLIYIGSYRIWRKRGLTASSILLSLYPAPYTLM